MMNQPTNPRTSNLPIPDGQERLATQLERADVNRRIEAHAAMKRSSSISRIARECRPRREAGDQVNRFLLCALVNESSRQIKERTRKAGNSMPMSMIVRGVLRSYRRAAMDQNGPLAAPSVDLAGLQRLSDTILTEETARLALERVTTRQARLARAEQLGDDESIKTERIELERAIEFKDRLAANH